MHEAVKLLWRTKSRPARRRHAATLLTMTSISCAWQARTLLRNAQLAHKGRNWAHCEERQLRFQRTAGKRPQSVAVMQQLSAALSYFPPRVSASTLPKSSHPGTPGKQVTRRRTATPHALTRASRADQTITHIPA